MAVLAIALLVAGTATSLTLLHHRELGAVPGSVRWHSGQVSEFDGDFYLESDLVLPDTGTFQVASIHSLDIGRKGEFLIADIRNSNVKVFNQEGEPLAVVGRYGGGLGNSGFCTKRGSCQKGGWQRLIRGRGESWCSMPGLNQIPVSSPLGRILGRCWGWAILC